jgi:AAA+ ATPase superfamily predicted ATPase
MPFLNRTEELRMLRERLAGTRAELLVVYGRRRVGKTELLTHLASGIRSLYFEATNTVALDQLRDLTAELARASGRDLLAAQQLTSWEAALAAVSEFVGDRRTLVVLDEFQLLAGQAPELETVLSRWWRTSGRHLPLVLVLAGSELSFFEDEVLSGQLYGRRTGQLKLLPFLAREAALFHPGYDVQDRVRAHSVCGGMPYYLERFGDDRPLADHLLAEVFERTGLLRDEAELMLRQSISDPTNHGAVLRSIAHGHNHNSQISQRTQLSVGAVAKLIDVLERLGLVERMRPITASPRSKKIAYAISDQFLRFHYRFVEPARSQLRTSLMAETYLDSTVLPQLDHHASHAWEDICREHVLHTVEGVTSTGRWWGQVPTGHGRRTEEREIDVVGVDGGRTPLVVGMCKWTADPVDFDELNLLDRLTAHIEGHTAQEERYLFSRSGFQDRLRVYAESDPRLHLVSPSDIYQS